MKTHARTKPHAPVDEETRFLNVDLDVYSREPLEPLVAAFGRRALVHYVGRVRRRYQAHFSLYFPRNADAGIRQLARIIEALPPRPRRLWKHAGRRVFNVGFQAGTRRPTFETEIGNAAIAAAMRLGASIVVTIYPADITSSDTSASR